MSFGAVSIVAIITVLALLGLEAVIKDCLKK